MARSEITLIILLIAGIRLWMFPSVGKMKMVQITFTVLLVAGCAFLAFPSVNQKLSRRGIPRLPASAIIEHETSGGFFTGWLFVKASIPESDFYRYSQQFTQKKEIIGPGETIIRNIRKDTATPDDIPHKQIIGVEYLAGTEDWWKTDEIQRGYLFQWTNQVDAWRAYFDEQRHIVYIYWCHS